MRKAIHSLLVELSRIYKPSKRMAIYPPKINISKDQRDDELIGELRKMINFMKNSEYSYMSKDKYGYK